MYWLYFDFSSAFFFVPQRILPLFGVWMCIAAIVVSPYPMLSRSFSCRNPCCTIFHAVLYLRTKNIGCLASCSSSRYAATSITLKVQSTAKFWLFRHICTVLLRDFVEDYYMPTETKLCYINVHFYMVFCRLCWVTACCISEAVLTIYCTFPCATIDEYRPLLHTPATGTSE